MFTFEQERYIGTRKITVNHNTCHILTLMCYKFWVMNRVIIKQKVSKENLPRKIHNLYHSIYICVEISNMYIIDNRWHVSKTLSPVWTVNVSRTAPITCAVQVKYHVHAMKAYGEVQVQLQSVNLATIWGKPSAPHAGHFTLVKEPLVPTA
jgi:hypothetical protein